MTKTESKVLVQVDSKAYAYKPEGKEIGGIKSRTQKSEAKNLTIEEIATEIEQGKSFSPGILEDGLGASNWKEQQIFGIDIDNNDETLPILTPKEAIKICKDNGMLPALCYKTFSDIEVKPKFRFMFKLNEPLKDKSKRLLVASTLVALFPQADKSCVNADRIFFGTNRKVKILNKTVSFDKILELSAKQAAPVKEVTELDKLKSEFDFESFLNETCGEITRKTETYIMYKNCPICGHHDDFIYYKKSKTFKCFGAHGGAGGSIIDYLMATSKLSRKQAIDYFKHELCGLPKTSTIKTQPSQKLETISSYELVNTTLAPLHWCVDDLFVQGATVLASPPKFGKSWLMLDLCNSVANGKDFLGFKTHQSRTLYLALEDSPNRLKGRIAKIIKNSGEPSANFDIATKSGTLSNGLINMLEDYVAEKPDTKLIVIDTLQKVRAMSRNNDKYASDYDELGALKAFADKYAICLVLVHHLKKGKENDPFDKISGTNAIMGASDTSIVLTKEDRLCDTCTMHITGRDVKSEKLILEFDKSKCVWICNGNAEYQAHKRAIKEYNENPITIAIRELMELEPHGWSGNAEKLLKVLQARCHFVTDDNPAIFAKKLNKLTELFKEVDRIFHTPPPPNGSNGKRLHKFIKGYPIMDKYSDIDDLFN